MLHEPQVVEAGDVVVADLKSFFEHLDGSLELLGVLVGQPLAVVEFGVGGHQLDGAVEVLVG